MLYGRSQLQGGGHLQYRARQAPSTLQSQFGKRQKLRARPNPNPISGNPSQHPIDATGNVDNSWMSDPVYQRILALQNQNIANAQSSALSQRQQLLTSFGYDPSLSGLFQEYGASQQAAQNNPFSILANLARSDAQNVQNIQNRTGANNTIFGSANRDARAAEQTNYLAQQSQANSNLRNQMDTITNNLLKEQQSAQDQITAAATDAYNRALSYALQYGLTPAEAQQAGQQAASQVVVAHPARNTHHQVAHGMSGLAEARASLHHQRPTAKPARR